MVVNTPNMDRWHAKVITLIGCFLIPFVCTVLPIKLTDYFERKGSRGKLILSCLMCFGGGVFFSTFILHMAPEARDILTFAMKEVDFETTYPIPDLVMAIGFFLVLFTEKVILIFNEKRRLRSSENVVQCVQYNKSPSPTHCPANHAGQTVGNRLSHQETNGKLVDIEDLAKGDRECSLYGTGSCCKDPDEIVIQANAKEETGKSQAVGRSMICYV